MSKENRRTKSAKDVRHLQTMFACPVCHTSMRVVELKSLICSNHHTFDIARQGYINMMTQATKTKYSKALFEARRKLMVEDGFFRPLSDAIANMLHTYAGKTKETVAILDTGCGEGSHLSAISDIINADFYKSVVGIGIDISKEGIITASKNYTDKIWVVADLAKTPFKEKQFGVILNILSPSNYKEFNRLLKTDGFVVKVVPQSGYLRELREHLFRQPEKQTYSNTETVERFDENLERVDRSRLSYSINLNQASIQALVQMTPLTWRAAEKRVKSFLEKDVARVTVDLDILIGKKLQTVVGK